MESGRRAHAWPILVVDDEERYRRTVAQMLTLARCRVLEAEDGQAADHRVLQEPLERCRKGESIRSVECQRLEKSGREHKRAANFCLRSPMSGAPRRRSHDG
jgi:CheY-like chemotaxis protein